MPPGVHRNKEPVLHLSAKPAHESAPPGPPLNANTIHEHFRALSAGRDCLVDTPFEKELEARWSAQTASTEFTTPVFEETLVLTSSFYLLSEKQRARERRIAWQSLEHKHSYGSPTLPAHGIICGHETFRLYARAATSTVAITLLRSVAILETAPSNHFTARPAELSVRRGNTLATFSEDSENSHVILGQMQRLLGQLAKQQFLPDEPIKRLPSSSGLPQFAPPQHKPLRKMPLLKAA